MKNIPYVILLLILPVSVTAEPGDSSPARLNPSFYFAQNTENKKEDPEKSESDVEPPPFPPAKVTITTEKPVRGIPGEKKREKKEEENAQSPVAQEPITEKVEVKASPPAPIIPSPVEEKTPVAPPVSQKDVPEKVKKLTTFTEELSIFNVATANFRTIKVVIDDDYNLRGMVYGDGRGYIRILKADNEDTFTEVWKSPPLNSPIRGLFIQDLDGDGETEIVVYTADGNIYIYGYQSHDLIYKTPEGTYQNINCMVVANLDRDPQMELLFIGVKRGSVQAGSGEQAGNLIQFDTKTQFDEWTSSDLYTATDMLIGNIDSDPEAEIILNTGEILSTRFKNVKWEIPIKFGSRLYLIDLDGDGILELVTEYGESYVRIFDIDQQREKW